MSPKHVKPFISKQKTDANDAIGIAIASSQISMSLCQVKTVEQPSLQSLQVSRKWFDKTITSQGNHMRALCYEFGATIAKSKVALGNRILALLNDEDIALPHAIKRILGVLWEQYTTLSEQKNTLTKQIEVAAADLPQCQQLMKIEGIGSIGAVGLVSSLGDGGGLKMGGMHQSILGPHRNSLVVEGKSSCWALINMGVTKRYAQFFIKGQCLLFHDCQTLLKHTSNNGSLSL
jgi:transposase